MNGKVNGVLYLKTVVVHFITERMEYFFPLSSLV
jgi:hypothetical protein